MKQRSILFLFICILTVGLMAAPAHADTYTYGFYGADFAGQGVGFQYTTNALITAPTTLTLSQLDFCINCQATTGAVVYFAPNVNSYGDIVHVTDANGYFNSFVFDYGTTGTVGDWGTDWFNSGSLYVNVPEPSSAGFTVAGAMMLAGLCLSRRKLTGNQLA